MVRLDKEHLTFTLVMERLYVTIYERVYHKI